MWIENPPSNSLKDLAFPASLIYTDDKDMNDLFGKVISGQVAINSIENDEKSLSANPTASQERPADSQRPDRNNSEFPAARTPVPNEKNRDSSAAESLVQKIGAGRVVTIAGFVGLIITAILMWRWKSKSTPCHPTFGSL